MTMQYVTLIFLVKMQKQHLLSVRITVLHRRNQEGPKAQENKMQPIETQEISGRTSHTSSPDAHISKSLMKQQKLQQPFKTVNSSTTAGIFWSKNVVYTKQKYSFNE